MSDLIHIGRLRARYRIRGEVAQAKERLDAILRRLLEDALETAVARLGLSDSEEICVRALRVPASLSLDGTDASIAASWGVAFAEALREALASGSGIVRFRSRRHALLDLVRSAAQGDLSRGWAWAQLELWDASVAGTAQVGEAIATALCALPDAAAAAIAEAARHGALPLLVTRLPAREWERVARAALHAFGADESALGEWTQELEGGQDLPPRGSAVESTARERAERIRARSPLAAALARIGSVEPVARHALLALAALETEPDSLTRSSEARAVLAALERAMSPGAAQRAAQHPSNAVSRGPHDPGRGSSPSTGVVPSADGSHLSPLLGGTDRAGQEIPLHGLAGREVETNPPRSAPVDSRPSARTRAGGLLYLLHLLADRAGGNAPIFEGAESLAARPLRFALHALALTLIPVEPNDPAALAFCGLAPDDEPPEPGADKLTDAERAALETASAAIANRLRIRLGRENEPARAVLLETCRRDAEVIADPGWIEVHFSLEDADPRVRRAGLDLDPGWLPWLGCVVRFVYA